MDLLPSKKMIKAKDEPAPEPMQEEAPAVPVPESEVRLIINIVVYINV